MIVLLLSITLLQFVVLTYMRPPLRKLMDASPDAIGLVFALYAFGFVGIVIASRIVDSWGAWRTSLLFGALIMVGIAGWTVGLDSDPLMPAAVVVWGLGFAAANSMPQVRSPLLASATVALNISVLHIG